ncbi:MAG: hypothetical protein ACRDZX_15085 [Acidimicrobiales bacterium]
MSIGFAVIFPLASVSNALLLTLHMRGWLRLIAGWSPGELGNLSQGLFGKPNPVLPHPSWPVGHPLAAA